MKQDERYSKISHILLPWQHSRFEPSLIRNTILIFYSPVGPQWGFSCFRYGLALLDQFLTAIGLNCLPVRGNISKKIEKGFGT